MQKKKQKSRVIKSNHGITVIALVVTIIVMIILAAVSIIAATSEHGILTETVEKRELADSKRNRFCHVFS